MSSYSQTLYYNKENKSQSTTKYVFSKKTPKINWVKKIFRLRIDEKATKFMLKEIINDIRINCKDDITIVNVRSDFIKLMGCCNINTECKDLLFKIIISKKDFLIIPIPRIFLLNSSMMPSKEIDVKFKVENQIYKHNPDLNFGIEIVCSVVE